MGQELSSMRCVTNGPQLAVYGWQRKCLFMLLLGLFLLVFVNFAVTLWLIKLLEFNVAGLEGLDILVGGVRLPGNTLVMGSLISSNIYSNFEHPIVVDSQHNFTMDTRDHLGHITNSLFIDDQKIQSHASIFGVSDSLGRRLFSVDRHEIVIGADSLRLSGIGGAVFEGSFKTNEVDSGIGTNLRLESPTKLLQINAPSGLVLDSIAGDISASSMDNITLESLDGGIQLEASSIYLPGLEPVHSNHQYSPVHHNVHRSSSRVYQLCACDNGKLFVAPSTGHCAINWESTICR